MMEVYKDGEKKYSIDKSVRANLLLFAEENPDEIPDPCCGRHSMRGTISGRRRLRSSAALASWLTKLITEYEVHLSSPEALPPGVRQAMARRSTTSPESAPKSQMRLGTLWSEATASPQDLENALQMFSRECSGPH